MSKALSIETSGREFFQNSEKIIPLFRRAGKELSRQIKGLLIEPAVLTAWGDVLYAYSMTGNWLASIPMVIIASITTGTQIYNQSVPLEKQIPGLSTYTLAACSFGQGIVTGYNNPENILPVAAFTGWGLGFTLLGRSEQILKHQDKPKAPAPAFQSPFRKTVARAQDFIDRELVPQGGNTVVFSNAFAAPETAPLFLSIVAMDLVRNRLRNKNVLKAFDDDSRVNSPKDFLNKHSTNLKLSGTSYVVQALLSFSRKDYLYASATLLWGIGGFFFDKARNGYLARDLRDALRGRLKRHAPT